MTEDSQSGPSLKREVGLAGVASLGVGTAIGVSIFSILQPAAALAGPAMLVSMLIAMVPMIVFGIIYAFMGSAVPVTGASFEWPRRFVHPFLGFFISWLRMAGSTAAMIVLTMVLVSYIGNVVDVPLKPVMFGILLLVFLLNMVGLSAATLSQSLMLLALIGPCFVYVVTGIPKVEMTSFSPFASAGIMGILGAVPLLISLFLGIETAVEVGGEIRKPARTIPLGISISVLLTALIYFIVAVVTIGLLGGEELASSSAPLLEGAQKSLGEAGTWLILITAIVSIGSSINATFIIFTRFLFAMGKQGMLPTGLSYVHAGTGVPRIAVCVAFGMCLLGLFLPDNLIFLFLAVNIPTILKYMATCLATLGLFRKAPELHAEASFRPPKALLISLSCLGLFLGLAIIILGLSADWTPYIALILWAVLGVVWYLFYPGRKRNSSAL